MAWSGGSFSRTNGVNTGASVWADDKAAGVKIVSGRHDTHDQDLATGINSCLHKAGQNTPTANLPMGGFLHTNVGEATARTHYARHSQVQDSAPVYGSVSGGTANAQTVSLTPAITGYAGGQRFIFVAGNTNTGACTLNVNGVGAKNITYKTLVALAPGAIIANQIVDVVYDGTQFQIQNPAQRVYGVAEVAGAGTDQAGATLLTKEFSIVTSGASNSGVRLPAYVAGARYVVRNTTLVTIKVYPPSGGQIDTVGTDVAVDMPLLHGFEFIATGTSQCYAVGAF